MLGYLLIGYLANNLLPARLGELVRATTWGSRGHQPDDGLGTIVVERVVDTGSWSSIASLAILVLQVRGLVASAVLVGPRGHRAARGRSWSCGSWRTGCPARTASSAYAERWPRIPRAGRRLHDGLAVARRPRTLGEAIVLSFVAWGATVVAFAAAGQSLGHRAHDGPGGAAGGGRRARVRDPGRSRQPRHVRPGGRDDRARSASTAKGARAGAPRPRRDPHRDLGRRGDRLLRLGWNRSAGEVAEIARGLLSRSSAGGRAGDLGPDRPGPAAMSDAPAPGRRPAGVGGGGEAADIAALADPRGWVAGGGPARGEPRVQPDPQRPALGPRRLVPARRVPVRADVPALRPGGAVVLAGERGTRPARHDDRSKPPSTPGCRGAGSGSLTASGSTTAS